MQELEAAEAVVAEAFVRQRDAAAAQRLVVARQMELLQQATTGSVPPLVSFPTPPDHASLPPHLEGPLPHIGLGHNVTHLFSVGASSIGSETPENATRSVAHANAAPHGGMPRPE